jgi:hypothetical protein
MSRRPLPKGYDKRTRPSEWADNAARQFVCNLYDATSGAREPWRALRDLDENLDTIAWAVHRGWVRVATHGRQSGVTVLGIALTDEGRRMARMKLH